MPRTPRISPQLASPPAAAHPSGLAVRSDRSAAAASGRATAPSPDASGEVHGHAAPDADPAAPKLPARLRGVPQSVAIGLIKAYAVIVSPLLGGNCRYLPTCSAYGEEAIRHHGVWYGGWMTLARLLRCHPWGASGFDPVPEAVDPRAAALAPWRAARWTGAHIDPATRLDR